MSPHYLLKVRQLLLYLLLLLTHGAVGFAVGGQDTSLQVVGLVYLTLVTAHGKVVVGRHVGHIIEIAAHDRQS